MPKLRAFKIWYSDKTFDSTQAVAKDIFDAWKEAPKDDVQFVVFYFEENDSQGRPTRRIMHGDDYYALDSATGEITQSFDDINAVKGEVKLGKWTTEENHIKQHAEAYSDYGEGWLWLKPAPVKPQRSQKSIEQDI